MSILGMLVIGVLLLLLGCFIVGFGATVLGVPLLVGGLLILGYALHDFLTFDKDENSS